MSGAVDYIYDTDYLTVEEAPTSLTSGVRHTRHEETPGPRPSPPAPPPRQVTQFPPRRKTKRLKSDDRAASDSKPRDIITSGGMTALTGKVTGE